MPNLVGGAGLAMEGLVEVKREEDLTPSGITVGTYAGLLGGMGGGDPRPACTTVFLGRLEGETGVPCPPPLTATLTAAGVWGMAVTPPLFDMAAMLGLETFRDVFDSAGFSEGVFLSRIVAFSLVGDVLLNCMMARLTLESLPAGKTLVGVTVLPGG